MFPRSGQDSISNHTTRKNLTKQNDFFFALLSLPILCDPFYLAHCPLPTPTRPPIPPVQNYLLHLMWYKFQQFKTLSNAPGMLPPAGPKVCQFHAVFLRKYGKIVSWHARPSCRVIPPTKKSRSAPEINNELPQKKPTKVIMVY